MSSLSPFFGRTVTLTIVERPVRVVRLTTLADLKRGATTPEDQLTLAILEDTLRSAGRR